MVTSIKGNDTSTFGGNVDVTGNVITDAPAFYAVRQATHSISTATWTKVQCGVERFDVTNDYDTTNFKFQPSVEGYYQINACIRGYATNMTHCALRIYKNGSATGGGFDHNNSVPSGTRYKSMTATGLMYFNGTTDYIELYGRVDGTSPIFDGATTVDLTYWSGYLARAV